MSDLKVAVITGAGSGIGRAVALHLAAAGYQVALAGRRLDALEETKKEGGALAANLHPIVTDVSDEASVNALFAEVVRRWRLQQAGAGGAEGAS
jgi:NADP-dependent 3-hydroxy acid dehydrogenase YdfG